MKKQNELILPSWYVLTGKEISQKQKIAKRAFDLFCSAAGLIVFFPFFVLISLLVLLSSGWPIFFIQIRYGQNEKKFKMIKFRTMKNGAGSELVTNSHDPRVTKIGIFLRKYKLDELPQLINVLLGQMSLVGDRPLPKKFHLIKYNGTKKISIYMLPGLTGLYQILYIDREKQNLSKSLEFDMTYYKNYCLKNDFKIIIQTIILIYQGKFSC